MGFFYFVPNATVGEYRSVLDNPEAKPLAANGPWAGISGVANGKRGLIVFPAGGVPPEHEIEWQDAEDGLLFGVDCKGCPKLAQLQRDNPPPFTNVLLASGDYVRVAFAATAPRKLLFGAKAGLGESVSKLSTLSSSLWEKWSSKGVPFDDPDLNVFIYSALAACYKITPELLNEVSPITTLDIQPLLDGIWNLRPKEEAPEAPISP